LITEIGIDYFRELPYSKSSNNYLLFLCAIFFFEHVTAIMSGNCAINFHRSHFNKILVVFRCFGEIEQFYLFLGLSGIFTGPLRVFLGNMGVFFGKCMDRDFTIIYSCCTLKQVNVLRKLNCTICKQTLSNIYLPFIRTTLN
jgi:hypothetical protein